MTVALVAVSACLLVAQLCLLVVLVRRRIAVSLVGLTVAVTTVADKQGYRGVVLAEHADRITLHQAFAVIGGVEQPVGGLLHLYRKDFAAVQQIEG